MGRVVVEQVIIVVAAIITVSLSPAAFRGATLPKRLLHFSQGIRATLVRRYGERDSDLYHGASPFPYQLWGTLGGAQAEIVFHHSPIAEKLHPARIPEYNKWMRGSVDASWEAIDDVWVTLALGPHEGLAQLEACSVPAGTDTPEWFWELDEPRELGVPGIEGRVLFGGDEARWVAALDASSREMLRKLFDDEVIPLVRMTVHAGRLRATFRAPTRRPEAPLPDALARLAVWVDAIARRAPDEVDACLGAIASENGPTGLREKALSLLLERAPDGDVALAAVEAVRTQRHRRLVVTSLLGAPALFGSKARRRDILVYGALEHPRRGVRLACASELVAHHMDHVDTHRALERLSLHDPDPELRARAAARVITDADPELVDIAAVILAGQRLARHDALSSTTRQRLQLALIRATAKPTAATYARLAREHTDSALRYASLRALVTRHAHERACVETLAWASAHDPVRWISSWCGERLDAFEEHAWEPLMRRIARDASADALARIALIARLDSRVFDARLTTLLSTTLRPSPSRWCVEVLCERAPERARHVFGLVLTESSVASREMLSVSIAQAASIEALSVLGAHTESIPALAARAIPSALVLRATRRTSRAIEAVLIDLLSHRDISSREATLDALGRVGSPRCEEHLLAAARRSPILRERALDALAAVRSRALDASTGGQLTLAVNDESGALTMEGKRGSIEMLKR